MKINFEAVEQLREKLQSSKAVVQGIAFYSLCCSGRAYYKTGRDNRSIQTQSAACHDTDGVSAWFKETV
jgi:hypothetical protein